MRYRADIDGLRAISVIAILLYHANIAGFKGGFVGVDVFFVISGYLITSIIAQEIKKDQFSITGFYERRIRRIFPALFMVLGFSYIMAFFLMMPYDFKLFSLSLVTATLFTSNLTFEHQAGYFDSQAEAKPLLHTWSLAVEEQFYIFFPLFLIIINRYFKGKWVPFILGAAIVSLILSIWCVVNAPNAAFYLAPFRCWELMLGSMLSLKVLPKINLKWLRQSLGGMGLALVFGSIWLVSKQVPFPGLNALYPTMGAAFIIYSGEYEQTWVSRLLGNRAFSFIGKISYSLYLWHWPLLVFAQYYQQEVLTPLLTWVTIFFSVVVAILSWKFVESPFRSKALISGKKLFSQAGLIMTLALILGLTGFLGKGLPARLPERVNKIAEFATFKHPYSPCFSDEQHFVFLKHTCNIGAEHTEPTIAVWGDSHAEVMLPMLESLAKEHHQAIQAFSYGGCPPLLGVKRAAPSAAPHCLDFNRQVMTQLTKTPKISTVVLIGSYAAYLEGSNTSGRIDPEFTFITNETGTAKKLVERQQLFITTIQKTIGELTQAHKRVILVYPVPETIYRIPAALSRWVLAGKEPSTFTRPATLYQQREAFVFKTLDGLGKSKQIIRIYPHQKLCNAFKCIVYHDGKPLYIDDNHLTSAGSEYIKPLFYKIFE